MSGDLLENSETDCLFLTPGGSRLVALAERMIGHCV
jgi:hypothetical protein